MEQSQYVGSGDRELLVTRSLQTPKQPQWQRRRGEDSYATSPKLQKYSAELAIGCTHIGTSVAATG